MSYVVKYLIIDQQIADLQKRITEDSRALEKLKRARSQIGTDYLGMVGFNKVDEIKQQLKRIAQ